MTTLYLILTNKCNNNCRYCFYNQEPLRKVEDKLTYESLCSVILQASELGYKEVSFTGGEPLLFKDIFKLIKYSHNLNLITTISTNAVLLNTKTISSLKDSGLDNIYISTSSDFFENKRYLKLDKILREISIFGINSPTLVFVVTAKNINSLSDVIDYAINKDIYLQLQPAFIPNKENLLSLFNLSPSKNILFNRDVKRWGKLFGKKNYANQILANYDNLLSSKKPKHCHFVNEDLVINADGNVYPCFHRLDLKLGNILNDSLANCVVSIDNSDKKTMFNAKCYGEHCISLFS